MFEIIFWDLEKRDSTKCVVLFKLVPEGPLWHGITRSTLFPITDSQPTIRWCSYTQLNSDMVSINGAAKLYQMQLVVHVPLDKSLVHNLKNYPAYKLISSTGIQVFSDKPHY